MNAWLPVGVWNLCPEGRPTSPEVFAIERTSGWEHAGSQLNLNAQVGLMLSNVFKEEYYPTANLQNLNGTMMSISLGVQYMFAL